MAASFQAKDSGVLNQQMLVQELCLNANNPLLSVSGSDLALQLNEAPSKVVVVLKCLAAGGVSAIATSVSGTQIILTGESAALASTVYIVKYQTAF